MTVKITCPNCGVPNGFPDDAIGMKGRCNACRAIFDIGASEHFPQTRATGTSTALPSKTIQRLAELHPRLGNQTQLQALSLDVLVWILKELADAGKEIDSAAWARRNPALPSYFNQYQKRARTAELIGRELHRRGGTALVNRVLNRQLGKDRSIHRWWSGIR